MDYPELQKLFDNGKAWSVGHDVPTILKALDVFKNRQVIVNFPYHTFNMKGTGSELAASVGYEKTNYGTFIHPNTFVHMFYGNTPCDKYNYLPIYADTDVYYIEKIEDDNDPVIITLTKAPSWRTYL